MGEARSTLGLARRDASMTLVGICQESAELPASAPVLRAGNDEWRPVGGLLRQLSPSEWANYLIYPATEPKKMDVVQAGRRLGTVTFLRRPRTEACPRTSPQDLRILACGSIFVAAWEVDAGARADEVELIDVQVAEDGRPLGFYLHRVEDSAGGLRIVFGFQPPRGNRIRVAVDEITLRGEDGLRITRPRIAAAFRLSPS